MAQEIIDELDDMFVYEILDGILKGEWIKRDIVYKTIKEIGDSKF